MGILAKDFIVGELNRLADKFASTTFILGNTDYSNDYFVEVIPEESYNSNEFLLAESEVIANFFKEFPYIGLTFISNDPYIKVTNDPLTIISSVSGEISKADIKVLSYISFKELEMLMKSKNISNVLYDANEEYFALAA